MGFAGTGKAAGPSTPAKPETKPATTTTATLPSLYPIYLPFTAQHFVLSEAQRVLEESCFEFLRKWMPEVLAEKGWECARAAELTESTRVLAKHAAAGQVPREAFVNLGGGAGTGTSLSQILFATNRLRHCAVHRLPNTARGIRDLCRCGYALAATLGDGARAARLDAICKYVISEPFIPPPGIATRLRPVLLVCP